jgi:hypothetical protein
MTKGKMKIVFLTVSILAFALFSFPSVLVYNKNRALAQEKIAPLICEQGSSLIQENELEIQIGRTTDYTEYLADQIISEMAIMILAAGQQIRASQELTDLVEQCSADLCQPECVKKCDSYTCRTCPPGEIVPVTCNVTCSSDELCCRNPYYGDYCRGCEPGEKFSPAVCSSKCKKCESDEICCATTRCDGEPCSGEPCPAEIQTKLDEILYQAGIVEDKQASIRSLWEEMNTEVPPMLERARTGFAKCVVRPIREASVSRGLLESKMLLDCRKVLESSIPIHTKFSKVIGIGQYEIGPLKEGCYGSVYCEKLYNKGKDLPYPPPPCAEDYFCCVLGG